jgi:hypothetical protein
LPQAPVRRDIAVPASDGSSDDFPAYGVHIYRIAASSAGGASGL